MRPPSLTFRSSRQAKERRGSAFTLLELLVVVVVISVLAALILPAFASAKGKARSVQCLNNLRQWNQAFYMYSDDTELIPREGHRSDGRVRQDSWGDVHASSSRDVWYNALPPYLGERSARTFFSSVSGERPKFYENRLFHCPSARFPRGVGEYNEAFFSLAMNSKLIQPPVLLSHASIPFSDIQYPAATVTFADARVSETEMKVDPAQWDFDLGQPSIFASRFSARHGGRGNLTRADGSASSHPGAVVVEKRVGRGRGAAIFPNQNLLWCVDPLQNPNTPD